MFFEDNTFRIGKNEGTLKYISLDKVTDLDAPIRKEIDAVYEFSTPPLPCWCERHAYIYFNFYLFAKTSLFSQWHEQDVRTCWEPVEIINPKQSCKLKSNLK